MVERWVRRPPLTVARGGLIDAVLKVPYAIGGFTTDFAQEVGAVERLGRLGGPWTPVAPMPTARGNASATAAGERIYVLGGFVGGKTVDVVEVFEDGIWHTGRPLPAARGAAAAATVDGRIYVAGGFDEDDSATDKVIAYEVSTDQWHSVRPMPSKRGLLKIAVHDGRLHAIGGRDDNAVSQRTAERYDPATDTWETIAPMATGRGNPGVTKAGRHVYAVGGQGAGVALRTTERYDPAADRWETLEPLLAVPRTSLSAATVAGSTLVAFGGFELLGPTPVASARVESLHV
ncbi:hypothetical protein Ade02nite_85070 [Paractinoplanes deccanensis]|uniref:Galactose oxidase n=1 Tax=Paractinoplanes deccanensis TaxID=113561 RepID=A0ABQ3YIN9_9ACTN|nr:kelch repeat-containing protein [Actinoplanes deccanensis]GID79866.1 hypothetical protein Ade02nite_85070 [Actinoplanes deccanensis]